MSRKKTAARPRSKTQPAFYLNPTNSTVPEVFTPAMVAQLREALELDQAEFGKLFRRDKTTVFRWETGRSPVEGPAISFMQILWFDKFC